VRPVHVWLLQMRLLQDDQVLRQVLVQPGPRLNRMRFTNTHTIQTGRWLLIWATFTFEVSAGSKQMYTKTNSLFCQNVVIINFLLNIFFLINISKNSTKTLKKYFL
jgi:hypothetical protein